MSGHRAIEVDTEYSTFQTENRPLLRCVRVVGLEDNLEAKPIDVEPNGLFGVIRRRIGIARSMVGFLFGRCGNQLPSSGDLPERLSRIR